MKCFLHIGTAKTATTTIQSFFDKNRGVLLNHGFIYTKKAGKTNNYKLPMAAYDIHHRDSLTKRHCLDTNSKLASYQKKVVASLTSEIKLTRKKLTKTPTIIFSSEHIHLHLKKVEDINKLKEILISMGALDIKVIVYLRRPADIINSLYSTAIKAGSCATTPPHPSKRIWNDICDHKRTIENFGSVFGRDAIIPRLFDKQDLLNGSVIDDILNVMGIPSDNYEIPKNENESLSLLGVNILRRINETIPMFVDGKYNNIRANLVSYFSKHFSDRKYIMPHVLYEGYDLKFQESNEWVRREYFPEKKTLFSSEVPKEIDLNASDIELDRMASMIADVWKDKQTICNKRRLLPRRRLRTITRLKVE